MVDIKYTGNVYDGGVYSGAEYTDSHDEMAHEPEFGPEFGPEIRPERASGPETSKVSGALNVIGAMASLALVAGVAVWGYKLMVRDVSGVPVVRAHAGPMRILPDDPGGQQAVNQGLAVNAVAANGAAAAPADRLLLAPGPVGLTDEDVAMGLASPLTDTSVAGADKDVTKAVTDAVGAFRAGSVDALVDQLVAGVSPLAAPSEPESTGQGVQPEALKPNDTNAETEIVILQGPGLTRSLRPRTRPARAVASASDQDVIAQAINGAVDTVASLDVDPASLPKGTRLAQLGAYDTPEIAREQWDRLYARFEQYLEGKRRVIQEASSGGRTFYRLRAMGFDDMSDARRFCSALMSENTDCIPVTTR